MYTTVGTIRPGVPFTMPVIASSPVEAARVAIATLGVATEVIAVFEGNHKDQLRHVVKGGVE